MSVFPFIRLPLTNIKNVMEMLDFLDLIRLSRCNTKLRNVARTTKQIGNFFFLPTPEKAAMNSLDVLELLQIQMRNFYTRYHRINPMEVSLGVFSEIGILISFKQHNLSWTVYTECLSQRYLYGGPETRLKIGNKIVPAKLNDGDELFTFWENRLDGLKALLDWTMTSFGYQLNAINICRGVQADYSNELRSIINHVKQGRLSYKECFIRQFPRWLSKDDYDFIMENMHTVVEQRPNMKPTRVKY